MSLMDQPGASVFSILADVVIDGTTAIQTARLKREAQRAARQAKHEAEVAEQRAAERQRAWLRMMQRQARERWAGDASREDARRLLGGRGGRKNPLDQRKFR